LFVTTSAISHQIKQLEDAMGVNLFEREHKKIFLTEFGQALLPGLSDGFDQLQKTVNTIDNMRSNMPVSITVARSFASKWLVPRLGRFHDIHPEIDSRIDTTEKMVDLTRDGVDLGIRYGTGEYPGLVSHQLMKQQVFPVCSPHLLNGGQSIEEPADLKYHQLLHYDVAQLNSSWPDWQMWLLAAGVKDIDHRRGLRMTQPDLIVQAALDGQGVALLGSVSVEDELTAGRLIKPFELSFNPEFSYYVCYAENKREHVNAMKFRDWLLEEVGQ